MDHAVRAHALPTLLAQAPADIEILSLDCFDTLIWRNVNAPADVFTDLPLAGGGIETRCWAERRARKIAPFLDDGREEVTIEEIYEQMLPLANDAERARMVQAELDAEARHCFAFAPIRDLIVDAKARGLKVIIVSDTYLCESQLRTLIARAGGEDLAAMIDRIFCSSVYGVSKGGGLFTHVLADLGVSPRKIVHVGDNRAADYVAAHAQGINGVHFEQFDADTQQRLRFEATAATLVASDCRVTLPAYQPHRARLSLRENTDTAYTIGHDVVGPVLHSFAGWVRDEALAMEEKLGRPVKLLFLLRDGYLPGAVFRAAYPEMADRAIDIELSRFTATAASFTDEESIRRYAPIELAAVPSPFIAKQLHFSKDETAKLARGVTRVQFLRNVLRPQNVKTIVARSDKFAQRLVAYLHKQGVDDGDAVMLIDLGYNGSVQNVVEPVLRARMKLEVSGRYLLLREVQKTGLDKSGFIDTRLYDSRLLQTLSENIALMEQVCTIAQGSVIDYRNDGTSVREKNGIKGAQSACRDAIQAACLDYARDVGAGQVRAPMSDDIECRRHAAVASLARLLFLPLAKEVETLEHFHHDVNLGTDETLKVVDLEAASQGLRQRGLFYAKNAMRTYLPGELQRHGLQINLSLLSARRFGLDLTKTDFDVGAIKLPVFLIDATSQRRLEIDAIPTAEGYYQALIPVGAGRFTAGIQIGQIAEWVQIEEHSFHLVSEFMETKPDEESIPATPIMDAMSETAPGLYQAQDTGFMLFQPPAAKEAMLLSLVFRPVVTRKAAPAAAASKKAA